VIYTDILSDALEYAKTDANRYPVATRTASANRAMERITSLIRKAEGRWQYQDANDVNPPYGTTNIVSGTGSYPIDVTWLRVQKVEALDANGNYRTLIPFDIKDPRCEGYSNLLNSTGDPLMYDKVGNNFILAPNPNYSRTSGLRTWYEGNTSYFATSDTTKAPGFNTLYHRLVPMWMAYDYALINSLNIKDSLRQEIQILEAELLNSYALRDRDEHVKIAVRPYNRFR